MHVSSSSSSLEQTGLHQYPVGAKSTCFCSQATEPLYSHTNQSIRPRHPTPRTAPHLQQRLEVGAVPLEQRRLKPPQRPHLLGQLRQRQYNSTAAVQSRAVVQRLWGRVGPSRARHSATHPHLPPPSTHSLQAGDAPPAVSIQSPAAAPAAPSPLPLLRPPPTLSPPSSASPPAGRMR